MYYIGIDLGTSSVKLLLVDETGKILNSITKEYPIYFPKNGWSEENPEDWLNATVAGIKELIADADKTKIDGISFGGQMHGLVILDKNNEVIRPAILWNDGRSTAEVEYLNNVIGKDKISQYTANIAFAGFTAPKLLWVRSNEPDNFKKINKIMLPKDYLAYQFSGVFCTDVSDASGTLLMDVEHKCWSDEMLEICGIDKSVLPKIYESYQVVGNISEKTAALIGVGKEVKIIAGGGDNAAAAVGTATVGNGACNISLGTSGTLFVSSEEFNADENNAIHSFAHADGKYHLMGCMLSAASCNKWWCENILQTQNFAKEQENIKNLGDNRVMFLPYLMGERCPHNDADARGVFIGMSLDTAREDMTLAILEGVAFGLRDSLEIVKSFGINIKRAKLCGGGAKSPLWRTIIANVLNISLDTVEVEEGPAFGAAILAMVGCGVYKNVLEATEKIVKIKSTTEPTKELSQKYEEKYKKYRKLYPTIKPLF